MKPIKLSNSPITYFINRAEHTEWVLFIHATFANHNMFKAQFEYFQNKFNILAIDMIGHGQSTNTKKGDGIDKTSKWIFDILKAENIKKYILSAFRWARYWRRILLIIFQNW